MALRASEGHLGRDGSRVRQDGGPPCTVAVCPYGARHGPWGGIDRGEDECVFTLLVFICVFERANDRSRGDTGDDEAEPPNNPIFSFV